jgi:hypothetical protein
MIEICVVLVPMMRIDSSTEWRHSDFTTIGMSKQNWIAGWGGHGYRSAKKLPCQLLVNVGVGEAR